MISRVLITEIVSTRAMIVLYKDVVGGVIHGGRQSHRN